MRYYKAVAIEVPPLIQWDCWANSLEELQSLGLENDPLIVPEENIPSTQYGVSIWKINTESGQLEQRTENELEEYRVAYEQQQLLRRFKGKADALESRTFMFQDRSFYMGETFRLLYNSIEIYPQEFQQIITPTGIYNLPQEQMGSFIQTYRSALLTFLNSTE